METTEQGNSVLTITEFARMGGIARAKALTQKQRSDISAHAALHRDLKRMRLPDGTINCKLALLLLSKPSLPPKIARSIQRLIPQETLMKSRIYRDMCVRCKDEIVLNYPQIILEKSEHRVLFGYTCGECGHVWTCAFKI